MWVYIPVTPRVLHWQKVELEIEYSMDKTDYNPKIALRVNFKQSKKYGAFITSKNFVLTRNLCIPVFVRLKTMHALLIIITNRVIFPRDLCLLCLRYFIPNDVVSNKS